MVSLRFPFLFSQPQKPPVTGRSRRSFSTIACSVAAAAAGATVVASQDRSNPFLRDALNFFRSNFNRSSPVWGSLSLAADPSPVNDPKTGVAFPSVLGDSRRLLGIGLRRKCVMGLKNIDVYAFGVYADNGDINKVLGEKYGKASASEIEKKDLIDDLMESDICMTVRLQIVYGRLSIRSVRSAFAESVGNRLQKFGGSDNKELLQRFTSQFKDEFKIPRGSIIDLSRERDNVLHTTIDGKEVGSIQSNLLCRSILDLYIGDDPFDRRAKEDIEFNLASCIQK
ncbi:Fatty-acid-binding protein [Actinidia chinensis var. chinensis]|uniref:Fatty-acid-binding protein n=1 Tax=Actinidia chinensis var. chinensis TaxID=1590841 RepID=A0A2R6P634_ACTCC|nr:Fatty-acid-binding protein [Actinidia chinensis var. chinensis]